MGKILEKAFYSEEDAPMVNNKFSTLLVIREMPVDSIMRHFSSLLLVRVWETPVLIKMWHTILTAGESLQWLKPLWRAICKSVNWRHCSTDCWFVSHIHSLWPSFGGGGGAMQSGAMVWNVISWRQESSRFYNVFHFTFFVGQNNFKDVYSLSGDKCLLDSSWHSIKSITCLRCY